MFAIIIAMVLAAAILFPDTPVGRPFRELLIEVPARKLRSLKRSHWMAIVIAVGMMAAFFIYAKLEGLVVFAGGLPDALTWFAVFDVATYIDVVALLALLTAIVRFKAVYVALRSVVQAVRRWTTTRLCGWRDPRHPRIKRRRPTRSRRSRGSAEDDESWQPAAVASA